MSKISQRQWMLEVAKAGPMPEDLGGEQYNSHLYNFHCLRARCVPDTMRMEEDSHLRESVEWFAGCMELKLLAKDPEHPGGWLQTSMVDLFTHLLKEVAELHEAMGEAGMAHIIDEAVDVANIAHMLADHARGMRARTQAAIERYTSR